jgi:hypothetical protein
MSGVSKMFQVPPPLRLLEMTGPCAQEYHAMRASRFLELRSTLPPLYCLAFLFLLAVGQHDLVS